MIGDQVWTQTNLNIPLPGMICLDCSQYGLLYTWEEAMRLDSLLPDWRLPSEKEWRAMEVTLGSTPADAMNAWHQVGGVFKDLIDVRYAGSMENGRLTGRNTSCTYWTSTISSGVTGSGEYTTMAMSHSLSTLPAQKNGIFMPVKESIPGLNMRC